MYQIKIDLSIIIYAYYYVLYGFFKANLINLIIMLIFFLALTLGFAFELGKNALKIDSRQMYTLKNDNKSIIALISGFKK